MFQPGNKYGKGRPVGSTNESSRRVIEIFKKHDFDVLEEMIALFNKTKDDPENIPSAVKLLIEMAGFIYAKRKSVEHSGEITNPYAGMTLLQLKEIGEQKLLE